MAPAQLSRLIPQISALSSLFEEPGSYSKSLQKLFEKYQSDVDISSSKIEPFSLIKHLNIPEIVISQLDISFNHLVKQYPQQAIEIAEGFWKDEYFEYKQLAILMLSKLPNDHIDAFFVHIDQWIDSDTETPIIFLLLDIIRSNHNLMQDDRWVEKITSWTTSDKIRFRKFGLIGIKQFIQSEGQYPSPEIINKIKIFFSDPNIKTNKEGLELIGILSSLSINETAAFLISIGVQNPEPEVKKFIRKCLQFFPQSLSDRIKKVSQI